MKSTTLEIYFWKSLERIILKKHKGMIPLLDSPKRFSLEKIKAKSHFKEYGLIYEKLQITCKEVGKEKRLFMKRDISITKEESLTVLESNMSFSFISKIKSEEQATFIATSVADILLK